MPSYLEMSQNISTQRRDIKNWQQNEKCKNYIQLDQLKRMKTTNCTLKCNTIAVK